MADFSALAQRIAGERSVEAQQELQQAQTLKKQTDQIMDIELSKLKMQVNDAKGLEQNLKLEEKQAKLNEQLIRQMTAASPGRALVGNQQAVVDQFAPEVAPDAAGLPLVDQLA